MSPAACRVVLIAGLLLCLQVHAQDDFQSAPEQVQVQELSVSGLRAKIEGGDGFTIDEFTAEYPAKVFSGNTVEAASSLQITFDVKKGSAPFKPQQAVVLLASTDTAFAAYFVAKGKKGSGLVATVTAAAFEKQLGSQSGTYDVVALVGDPSAPAGVRWALGPVKLALRKGGPVIRPLTALTQKDSHARPVIVHQHRPADKRPPAVVSLAFTGLALLPLPVLLVVLTSVVKVNFKAFPADGSTKLAALLFHAGIGSVLVLYTLFWLKLNLAVTLTYALGLGAFTAITGYYALSGLSAARLKKA